MKWFINLSLALLSVLPLVAEAQIENHDVRVGNSVYRTKNYAAAEKKYRSALSKNGSSFYANFNLGNALYRRGEWNTARNYYKKAVALGHDVAVDACRRIVANKISMRPEQIHKQPAESAYHTRHKQQTYFLPVREFIF